MPSLLFSSRYRSWADSLIGLRSVSALTALLVMACSADDDEPNIFACGPGTKVTPGGCELDDTGDGDGDTGDGDGDTGDGDGDTGDGDGDGDTGDGDGDTGDGDGDTGDGDGDAGDGDGTGGMGGMPSGGDGDGDSGGSSSGGTGGDGEVPPEWIVYTQGTSGFRTYAINLALYPPEAPIELGGISEQSYPTWSPDGRYIGVCDSLTCGYQEMTSAVPGPWIQVTPSGECDNVPQAISWSSDGSLLASHCETIAFAVPDPNWPPALIPVYLDAMGIGFSATGAFFAVGEKVFETTSRSSPRGLDIVSAQGASLGSLETWSADTLNATWSPVGDWVAWSDSNGTHVGDAARGVSSSELLTDDPESAQFVWAPDGSLLAVNAADTVTIYRAHAGGFQELGVGASDSSIREIKWSPDSRYLAVVGTDDSFLIDFEGADPHKDSLGVPGLIASWSFDSRTLALIISAGNIGLIEAATPGVVHELPASVLTHVDFSPVAPLLVVSTTQGTTLYDVSDVPPVATPTPLSSAGNYGHYWREDGKLLVLCSGGLSAVRIEGLRASASVSLGSTASIDCRDARRVTFQPLP